MAVPPIGLRDREQIAVPQSAHSATARFMHGVPASLSLSTCTIWQYWLMQTMHAKMPPTRLSRGTMEGQKETSSWYSSKLDIEKKFAVVQVEWADHGYRYDGCGGAGNLDLFIRK